MTTDDIHTLAAILQYKEKLPNSRQQLNRIFRNKSCATIVKELKALIQTLPKKDRHAALLIVVLSLLYKKLSLMNDIQKALSSEDLIPTLYGSLCILLCGKSQTMQLKIDLSDQQFPNRYAYLVRFFGEFGYWEYIEVLSAVKILAMSDKSKFEELAFKDTTRLILLNMISLHINEMPSEALVRRLLTDGDELQANIGFYFAVSDIKQDVRDYAFLRRNPDSPCAKRKHQIDQKIVEHLDVFYELFRCCTIARKASLLTNYILTEKEYPRQFGHWLMDATLQDALIYEITASGKIKNLDELCRMACLIHAFPCKTANHSSIRKDRLYASIITVLKNFLLEKRGIYSWDRQQEILFCQICRVLPRKFLNQLYTFLNKYSDNLMVSPLDEMVRFSIYLKDKRQWDICQGMMRTCSTAQ
jgi:hypothetical protein